MSFLGEEKQPDLLLLPETVTISAGEVILSNREDNQDSKAERVVWLDAEGVINGTDERKFVRVVFGADLARRLGILFIKALPPEEPDGS